MNPSHMSSLPERQVFCNRTLNMKSIQAIGYDMDYTLIHYRAEQWEKRAYDFLKQQFISQGWPLQNYEFDPKMVCRGLVLDLEKGNLLKTNRFGFVKQARHGTKPIDFDIQRKIYSRTIVDLSESRWIFLNTLFSLSEGCIYAQLVELLDQKLAPEVLGYADLYDRLRNQLEAAHMEGHLKTDIIAQPDRYVVLEQETAQTLLDQYHSGKKLLLITNSEWNYTAAMMDYSFNRFLPSGMTWRDLFELVIVAARKPYFFTTRQPIFEIINEEGHLKPTTGRLQKSIAYLGGSVHQIEKYLGLSGDEILYVGDHMFGDVHVTKNVLRWRTALILRELEEDILAEKAFRPKQVELEKLMETKHQLESELNQFKIEFQRLKHHYGPKAQKSAPEIEKSMLDLRTKLDALDTKTGNLAELASKLNNPTWGLLMRAGNDKSYLAYQVERYADIYTSRVSNLLATTPFVYFRSPRGSLPHDSVL